jgi:hypothetical protein
MPICVSRSTVQLRNAGRTIPRLLRPSRVGRTTKGVRPVPAQVSEHDGVVRCCRSEEDEKVEPIREDRGRTEKAERMWVPDICSHPLTCRIVADGAPA